MNRYRYPLGAFLFTLLFSGCGFVGPSASVQPTFYALDAPRYDAAQTAEPAYTTARRPTLIVNPTHAAAGYDSQHILYARLPHQLEYFAHSEWVDTPARMLTPLIANALARSGGYRAVVLTPSAAVGELRLDTEIVRLHYEMDMQPSRVRFTLRAYIVDTANRQVLAWREFDESVGLETAGPYGVVVASNRAVHNALEKLNVFTQQAAERWTRRSPTGCSSFK